MFPTFASRRTAPKILALVAATLIGLAQYASAQSAPEAAPTPESGKFTIGVQDSLRVVVWGEPELNLQLTVRPDGKISMPLVNDIQVAGRTPEEIRATLAERLANYIREPSVTVIVDTINSYRIYFLGEVRTQGAINFFKPTRLLQGIATAGGPTDFAKNEIVLLREVDGEERRIRIDYKKLLQGAGQENFFLLSGDTLIFQD